MNMSTQRQVIQLLSHLVNDQDGVRWIQKLAAIHVEALRDACRSHHVASLSKIGYSQDERRVTMLELRNRLVLIAREGSLGLSYPARLRSRTEPEAPPSIANKELRLPLAYN